MCGRYYIPEEDSAEELRVIIDEVNQQVHLLMDKSKAPLGERRLTDMVANYLPSTDIGSRKTRPLLLLKYFTYATI